MNKILHHLKELETNFNRDVAKELIFIFKSQFHDSKKEFKSHLESKNYLDASRLAHKMKSSAFNVGAKELGLIYSKIEKETSTSLTQENLSIAEKLFEEFENECQNWLSQ